MKWTPQEGISSSLLPITHSYDLSLSILSFISSMPNANYSAIRILATKFTLFLLVVLLLALRIRTYGKNNNNF